MFPQVFSFTKINYRLLTDHPVHKIADEVDYSIFDQLYNKNKDKKETKTKVSFNVIILINTDKQCYEKNCGGFIFGFFPNVEKQVVEQ